MDKDKSNLIKNFLFVVIFQGSNYLLPFLTYPVLSRVLSVEHFAVVNIAFSLSMLFYILNDFGMSIFLPREIAKYKSKNEQEKIDSSITKAYFIKFFLMIFTFFIYYILIDFKFKEDLFLFIGFFLMTIGNSFTPIWFFQGIERMGYITFFNIFSKGLILILIIIFITQDYLYKYIGLIYGISFLLSMIIANFIMFSYFKIRLRLKYLENLFDFIKSSFNFFISRIAVTSYTYANNFILGMYIPKKEVGFYSSAEKLYNGMVGMLYPVIFVFYPYMSRTKNIGFYKKIVALVFLGVLIFSGIGFLYADSIVTFVFGPLYSHSSIYLKLFFINFSIATLSILIGYPLLAAYSKENYANYSTVVGSIFYFILIGISLVLDKLTTINIIKFQILSQTLILSIRLWGLKNLFFKNG